MQEYLWRHPVQIYSALLVVFGKCVTSVYLSYGW